MDPLRNKEGEPATPRRTGAGASTPRRTGLVVAPAASSLPGMGMGLSAQPGASAGYGEYEYECEYEWGISTAEDHLDEQSGSDTRGTATAFLTGTMEATPTSAFAHKGRGTRGRVQPSHDPLGQDPTAPYPSHPTQAYSGFPGAEQAEAEIEGWAIDEFMEFMNSLRDEVTVEEDLVGDYLGKMCLYLPDEVASCITDQATRFTSLLNERPEIFFNVGPEQAKALLRMGMRMVVEDNEFRFGCLPKMQTGLDASKTSARFGCRRGLQNKEAGIIELQESIHNTNSPRSPFLPVLECLLAGYYQFKYIARLVKKSTSLNDAVQETIRGIAKDIKQFRVYHSWIELVMDPTELPGSMDRLDVERTTSAFFHELGHHLRFVAMNAVYLWFDEKRARHSPTFGERSLWTVDETSGMTSWRLAVEGGLGDVSPKQSTDPPIVGREFLPRDLDVKRLGVGEETHSGFQVQYAMFGGIVTYFDLSMSHELIMKDGKYHKGRQGYKGERKRLYVLGLVSVDVVDQKRVHGFLLCTQPGLLSEDDLGKCEIRTSEFIPGQMGCQGSSVTKSESIAPRHMHGMVPMCRVIRNGKKVKSFP